MASLLTSSSQVPVPEASTTRRSRSSLALERVGQALRPLVRRHLDGDVGDADQDEIEDAAAQQAILADQRLDVEADGEAAAAVRAGVVARGPLRDRAAVAQDAHQRAHVVGNVVAQRGSRGSVGARKLRLDGARPPLDELLVPRFQQVCQRTHV